MGFVRTGNAPRALFRHASTAIRRLAYRPAASALDIQFVTGRVYRYLDVPEEVALGLSGARSKGGYFNRALRDRFAYVRLPEWDERGGG